MPSRLLKNRFPTRLDERLIHQSLNRSTNDPRELLNSFDLLFRCVSDIEFQQPARPTAPPRIHSKRGFAQALAQVISDHPEAERIEAWFQDETSEGQKGWMWWPSPSGATT